MTDQDTRSLLLNALKKPDAYNHPVQSVRVMETHISWVLLTGTHAYKIKKPVNFGFLDFSTLEKRRFFCQEELRLNRRLAPELYLRVIAITGNPDHPKLDGQGKAFEYAVQMKQFAANALLENLLERDRLTAEHIDRLAEILAAFHTRIDVATAHDRHGLPDAIQATIEQNFGATQPFLDQDGTGRPVDELHAWSRTEFERCRGLLATRKQQGFIRECHGDLHLDNIVLLEERPTPFDCIEFSEPLRWIDVISEIAFLVMDLEAKAHRGLAFRFLNHYLAITGDYEGLRLLNYYRVYRAMVRAKVAALKLSQQTPVQQHDSPLIAQYHHYIALAQTFAQEGQTRTPMLLITYGFSGSGKSVLAGQLAAQLPAIHLRSDIERKRLGGFSTRSDTHSGLQTGLYTRAMNQATYRHLRDIAAQLLDNGFSVIIDATFLNRAERLACRSLAQGTDTAFAILHMQASVDRLRERVLRRHAEKTDASEAGLEVLNYQMSHNDPLDPSESAAAIAVNTDRSVPLKDISQAIARHRHPCHNEPE